MRDPLSKLHHLLLELKRRKVYQVAVTYLVVALVGLEAVGLLIPATSLPGWADELFVALAVVGFPVAVVVAWAFEVTPEGVRREVGAGEDADEASMPPSRGGLPAGLWAVVLLVVGVGAGWYLVRSSDSGPEVSDRSIAVLPFETLGQEEATAFTDGIHGDVLTRLSHVLDLSVISRTSVLRYRDPDQPLPSIAQELGVAWILHGEVQELENQVQVNARLVDARSDRQVWANSYRREMTPENLFDIQEDITRHIVDALQARLSPGEEEEVGRVPTENLAAYRLYAQGREHLDRRDEEGLRRALDYFQEAVSADSAYTLAWVGLADAWTLLLSYRYAEAQEVIPRAEEAVRRALELDPRSAEAHASLGLLHGVRSQGESALRELERAVELRPGYAEAHNWLSYSNLLSGNGAAALSSASRAVELNPLSAEAVSNLALSYLALGRLDEALREARRVIELLPEWSTGHFYEGLVLYEMRRFQESQRALRGLEVAWAGEGPRATLALALLAAGDSTEARAISQSLEAGETPFATGLVHLGFGEVDRAFAAFQEMEGWRDWPMLALHHLYAETWREVRDDARYRALYQSWEEEWAGESGSREGS